MHNSNNGAEGIRIYYIAMGATDAYHNSLNTNQTNSVPWTVSHAMQRSLIAPLGAGYCAMYMLVGLSETYVQLCSARHRHGLEVTHRLRSV